MDLLGQYSGWSFTSAFLDSEFWSGRLIRRGENTFNELNLQFSDLVRQGEIILLPGRGESDGRNSFTFIQRGTGNLFFRKADANDQAGEKLQSVMAFLKQNGSSPFTDIRLATGFNDDELITLLQNLLRQALITTNNYSVFTSLLESTGVPPSSSPGQRSSRQQIRDKVRQKLRLKEGNWFLTSSFAVLGRQIGEQERLEQQTRLLLLRHGILVKEWYRREAGFAPWFLLFQTLKRLEWQGEILRGYFIEGLSGIQYALPSALKLLHSLPETRPDDKTLLISTVDPALPFGMHIRWNIKDKKEEELSITRQTSNHLLFLNEIPVLYSENYGSRLWLLNQFDGRQMEAIIDTLKTWLRLPPSTRPVNKIVITLIDNRPAMESGLTAAFLANGFERDGKKMVLWPSGV
jgi:ATP-dependent Lhr-like helicase